MFSAVKLDTLNVLKELTAGPPPPPLITDSVVSEFK